MKAHTISMFAPGFYLSGEIETLRSLGCLKITAAFRSDEITVWDIEGVPYILKHRNSNLQTEQAEQILSEIFYPARKINANY